MMINIDLSRLCGGLRGGGAGDYHTPTRGVVHCYPPPGRRHKEGNFAYKLAERVAADTGIMYQPDVYECHNRDRLHPAITLEMELPQPNIIILDDIITTGITLGKCRELLANYNVICISAINN